MDFTSETEDSNDGKSNEKKISPLFEAQLKEIRKKTITIQGIQNVIVRTK